MPRILLLAVAALAPERVQAQDGVVAFVGVNVVTMAEERVLPRRTVLVRGGRITAVGPVDSVAVPAGARRIEGGGAFLMPGLIDAHAHPVDPLLHPLYVASGVTTVQYLNAFPEVTGWRAPTGMPGPRVEACAGPVSGLRTAEEARRVVARHADGGFRCIKPYDDMDAEAYTALVDAARARGMRTVSHIPRTLGWREMLAARPDAVAHAEEFLYTPIESQADLDSIVAGMRDGGIALVTTLTNYDLITRQRVELDALFADPRLPLVPAVERRPWAAARNRYLRLRASVPSMRRLLHFQRTLVKRMADAGVTVLAGTDAGNHFVLPGAAVHDELEQLVKAGMTPYQALRAATSAPAAFLGLDDEIGVVEVGMRADLVLVFGNPLDDVANARLIAGVMADGRWWDAAALAVVRDSVAARLAGEQAFVTVLEAEGVDAALASLAAPLRPRALHELGYQLWRLEDRLPEAIRVFQANARMHAGWAPAAEALEEARRAGSVP